jgi:hypothetical protein
MSQASFSASGSWAEPQADAGISAVPVILHARAGRSEGVRANGENVSEGLSTGERSTPARIQALAGDTTARQWC